MLFHGHALGRLLAFAILYIFAALVGEAFWRYVLGIATNWAPETTVMANGAAFMLGCGYALLKLSFGV